MSASDTGDEAPLVHFFNSVRNSDRASAPACWTLSFSSAASRLMYVSRPMPALTSAKRQSLDPHRRGIHPIAEFKIVGWPQCLEYLKQMTRDRDLADRVSDLAVIDPEAGCAAAVVAGHAIYPRSDQVGDVKTLLDVGDQLGRTGLARFEVQIIWTGRRRGRDAAMGMAGRDQPEFARGRAIQQPRRQHPLIDDRQLFDSDTFGVERLRAQPSHSQGIVDDANIVGKQLLSETVFEKTGLARN